MDSLSATKRKEIKTADTAGKVNVRQHMKQNKNKKKIQCDSEKQRDKTGNSLLNL